MLSGVAPNCSALNIARAFAGVRVVGIASGAFTKLLMSVPDVSPAVLIYTGTTQLRSTFSVVQMPGILVVYMAGIKAAFAVSIAMARVAFVICLSRG